MKKSIKKKRTGLFNIASERDTEKFGVALADDLEAGDVLALVGELGAGKTTLVKAIAKGLGISERISSPTFNIVKEYYSGRLPLYHFDAYRLLSGTELIDIGGEEYLYGNGISVIEWADIVCDALPEDSMLIQIEYGEKEGERIYRCIF